MNAVARMSYTCPPPCGHTITAESETELLKAMQEHAKTAHGMELPEAEARKYLRAAVQR
ncbi:MAG: DUF1059 domain-containing protein [Chloroflexi bacterium]|nr:DUF1059 domain-containing protein [Chloroflexota bacterium]